MHESAMRNAKRFFETYVKNKDSGVVVDIGAQNVNGSLKEVIPKGFDYVGVDFAAGIGVDVILKDPYTFPLPNNYADVVMSSSCLEHSEFFWLTFLEMVRITKPDGLIYLNVPSEGQYHNFPVDCWRFQIDASKALMNWGKANGYGVTLIEAYTDAEPPWHDMVAIYCMDMQYAPLYPDRIDLE